MAGVWVIVVKTESGDEDPPHVFARKPSDKKLEAFLREMHPAEWDDESEGMGFKGSWLYVYGPMKVKVHT